MASARDLALLLAERDRATAREDFAVYCARTIRGFKPTAFHLELCAELQAVVEGRTRRLLVEAPVRHGKTLLAAQRLPLWAMARRPRLPVMLCSYGGDLAIDSSRALRNLARTPEHLDIFPDAKLADDSQRVDHWKLATGAEFLAAGTGGAITGRGWELGILDDLLKGRGEADSPGQRDAVWKWYLSDFLSRSQGDAPAQVFITARWHLDDPAGRIREMVDAGAEDWKILTYAALDEDDNALAEELVPARELVHRRAFLAANGDSRTWHAHHMSRPVPEDGQFFKSEWFKPSPFRWTPEHARQGLIRVYGASDYAVSEGTGDWTVHLIFGVDPDDRLHILDMWRGRTSSDKWIDGLLDLVAKWKPHTVAEEAGGLAKAVRPLVWKMSRERRIYFELVSLPSVEDKMTRAQSIHGRMAMGMVFWPKDALWFSTAESECLNFPAGKHDDIVDCLSLAGRLLASISRGAKPLPEPRIMRGVTVEATGNPLTPVRYVYPCTFDELIEEHEADQAKRRRHPYRRRA